MFATGHADSDAPDTIAYSLLLSPACPVQGAHTITQLQMILEAEAGPRHQSWPLLVSGLDLPYATLVQSDLGEHSGVWQRPRKDPLPHSNL